MNYKFYKNKRFQLLDHLHVNGTTVKRFRLKGSQHKGTLLGYSSGELAEFKRLNLFV